MSTARPGARIKARTPEEFERWRRLAEKRQDRRTPTLLPPPPTTPPRRSRNGCSSGSRGFESRCAALRGTRLCGRGHALGDPRHCGLPGGPSHPHQASHRHRRVRGVPKDHRDLLLPLRRPPWRRVKDRVPHDRTRLPSTRTRPPLWGSQDERNLVPTPMVPIYPYTP